MLLAVDLGACFVLCHSSIVILLWLGFPSHKFPLIVEVMVLVLERQLPTAKVSDTSLYACCMLLACYALAWHNF